MFNKSYFKFLLGFAGIIALSALLVLASQYVELKMGGEIQEASVISSQ